MITAEEFARQLNAKRTGPGKWMAKCPAHDDRTHSLSIGKGKTGMMLLNCFAGCAFDDILKAAGIEPTKHNGPDHASSAAKPRIIATYDYHDAHGTLVYQVVRFAPKDFRQRRPDGHGDWIWKMTGVERVPYRLPQLLNASEVYVCEGEKDVANLVKLGLTATTNPGGAGKWPKSFARWFDGRHIVILPHHDEAGDKHAQRVADMLAPVTASIKIVRLPGLQDKEDPSDWIARGGTLAELQRLVDATPYFDPNEGPPQTGKTGPTLVPANLFVSGFKAPEYVIDGLCQRGRLYSETAPTGHGKTAVSLALDIYMATGKPLNDRRTTQGNIVYFAAENPDDVKARMILMNDRLGLDLDTLPIWFIEGGFNFNDWTDHIRSQVEAIGGALSITLDTGPAFQAACGFTEENDNIQALTFALKLRELTKLPGNPMVLVPTHPIKNATKDNLMPRGGSAFLNEVDGNLTLWAEGERETTELHWAGKLRGPAFDPIIFALEKGTCPDLTDADGRLIPSVWASLATSERAERAASRQREDEDSLLIVMHNAPDHSIASWATSLGWISSTDGEPLKSRVHRTLERLKAAKLATMKRDRWTLTGAGNKEAERLEEQAQ